MSYMPSLRLNVSDGPVSEYRLNENRVEFLLSNGTWRILEEADIQLHFAFHTEVAKWLQRETEQAQRIAGVVFGY